MASMRKNKKVYIHHDPELIKAAVLEIKNKKMSIRQAAKHFRLPLSTLYNKMIGKRPIVCTNRILNQDEENRLAEWLNNLRKHGFGNSHKDIVEIVPAMLAARSSSQSPETSIKKPSRQWLSGFFRRHPELSSRTSKACSRETADVSPKKFEKWFSNFIKCMNQSDPTILSSPNRIFIADDCGFSFDPESREVVASKGSTHVYNATSNTKAQVTVLACLSAAGQYTPPLLIYPLKRNPHQNLLEDFPEALLQVSNNGRITSAIFFSWLRDTFIPSTSNLPKPILLLVDGHPSHSSHLETSLLCSENNIILYCFLPQGSHIMQSLDQEFFGSFKSFLSNKIKEHVTTCGEGVKLDSFAGFLKPVWNRLTTTELASNCFSAVGIYPLDPCKIMTSNKLSPSSVDIPVNTTTLPDVPTESLTTQDQHETTAPLSIFTPPYPPEASLSSLPHDFFKCPKLPETSTSAVISQASTSSAAFSPDSVTYSVSITAILPDASTSYSVATSPAASSTFQILPEILSSTLPQSPPETPSSTSINLNSQQLNALKENSLFICDKMSRDELIMFHTRLAAPQDQSFLDPYLERKFEEFKRVIQSLVNVFKVNEEPPSKVTLTEGNILTLLPINGKKRKNRKRNRITPTLPSLLSGEEFGSASDKKSEENESDKRKVAKKLRREEKKTNNENAFIKLIQEMENIESHAHKDEHNGKKKGRKQTKKLTSINITQDRDSDANSAARKEMKEELAVNSDEALYYSDHQTNGSCLGCGQNYGGELLVQCEVCDSWWHKECTKTANNFNNKEQGFTFVCIQCCPNQLS